MLNLYIFQTILYYNTYYRKFRATTLMAKIFYQFSKYLSQQKLIKNNIDKIDYKIIQYMLIMLVLLFKNIIKTHTAKIKRILKFFQLLKSQKIKL
ncbi:unnamed protein product [Paramecium sonneborni]|uniref:Uncharacterized protein n=1 Tax=Paramecium sonneborni TaxID=65129 RepID=A0A8S1RBB6_9CILI|nr:unnamed protein product [Paramecium sonneborni]